MTSVVLLAWLTVCTTLPELAAIGIDINEMTRILEDEGVDKFAKPFEQLMERLAHRGTMVHV